jgi:hypothetical protein
MREGLSIVAENSAAAERLRETLDLIDFLTEESRAMMQRWDGCAAERPVRPSSRAAMVTRGIDAYVAPAVVVVQVRCVGNRIEGRSSQQPAEPVARLVPQPCPPFIGSGS